MCNIYFHKRRRTLSSENRSTGVKIHGLEEGLSLKLVCLIHSHSPSSLFSVCSCSSSLSSPPPLASSSPCSSVSTSSCSSVVGEVTISGEAIGVPPWPAGKIL